MGVALLVLHPGEGQQQTISVCFLVSGLQVKELVALIHSTALDKFITCKDAIDDVHVLIRRAHLDGDRLAVVGELCGRLVEPVVGLCGRHLVVEGEEHVRSMVSFSQMALKVCLPLFRPVLRSANGVFVSTFCQVPPSIWYWAWALISCPAAFSRWMVTTGFSSASIFS